MKRSSLAVFVPKSNPLSQKEQISFSDLRSESFIALSADVDSEYILLLNRLAAEAGFIPRISCYVPNENSFKINLIMGNGLFERLHFLMGFEEAMYALMEEPEECAALVSAIADFYIQIIEKVGKYYKPDYFTLLDDYAHKNGGLISPAMFREIIKPSLKRIVEAVEANGMKYIQHCCGQEQLFLDDFHDIGIRRIDPCQPCNDLPAMKKKYPDMGFMGGLDLQGVVDVPDVTEQQLRDEVDRCIREYGKTIGSYVIYGCSVDMYDPEAFKPGHKIGIIIDQAMKAAQ